MNHAYRLVWTIESQRYVPAPETARARGKGKREGVRQTRRQSWALILGTLLAQAAPAQPPAPNALPNGGQVVAGQAGITQRGNRMTVTQGSDKAIIDWQRFDIGRQAGVTFAQPSAGAVALNRVVAGDASQIHGQLTANGQIWLINPNGVIFGAGSRVDVGGLLASTLASTNEDFLAGQAVFTRQGRSGHVVNQGEVTAADGGLIALLAPSVRNEGVLRARLGNIALAAGERITLANGADGRLALAVTPANVQTLVDNKQLIVADGGQVIMTAKAADVLAGAVVANSGTVRAQTLAEKQGRLLLLADMEHGEVKVGGTLDASAPASSAPLVQGKAVTENGGFIETSAARVTLAPDYKVTTAAARGRTGTWLIDPNDYTIAATGGDISGSQLSTALVGSNVVIQSSGGGTAGQGDINVNDAVAWSSNTLTLTAARDININAVMTASGTSRLEMNTGTANGGDSAVADGTVKVGFAPGEANGFAGRVDFPGRSGNGFLTINGQDYTVIDRLGAAGSTTESDLQGMRGNLSGHYALGSAIEASATSGWNGGAGFEPVGHFFDGTFDGLGHTINGLTINRPITWEAGLFGVNRGSVRNVGLNGGSVTGNDDVGGLVGWNLGTINNAYATGNVTGDYYHAGGLVGENSGTINDAYATGSVTGNFVVGGLVGGNSGTINNAYATGSVTGNDDLGGLVGGNSETINNAYATGNVTVKTGNVTGNQDVGGLVGWSSGTINNVYATGSVTGIYDVGGLVGENSGTINDAYATGNVTGNQDVGGLVGKNFGTIDNTYATGSVTGDNRVGGLVGWNWVGTISNSYAIGSVRGDREIGGIVGRNSGTVVNSHYAIDDVRITLNGVLQDRSLVGLGGLYAAQYADWITDRTLVASDYFRNRSGRYQIDTLSDLKNLRQPDLTDFAKYRVAESSGGWSVGRECR